MTSLPCLKLICFSLLLTFWTTHAQHNEYDKGGVYDYYGILDMTLGGARPIYPRLQPMSESNWIKELIVAEHNKYRSSEGASSMEYMTWSDELAELSEQWSKGCNFVHGHPSDTGQNLYAFTNDNRINIVARQAIKLWFGEKDYYNFTTGHCADNVWKTCFHYTQVVWDKSNKIGCGWTNCKDLATIELKNALYFVCDYYPRPGGNMNADPPYTKGAPCTKCNSGKFWCFNGFCRADCSPSIPGCECLIKKCPNGGTLDEETCSCKCAAGWMGTLCEDKCTNKHKSCMAEWDPISCSNPVYERYMKEVCPLMCGVCECEDKKCYNGGKLESKSTCNCACVDNWIGNQCAECSIKKCPNGGTLDEKTCSCKCAAGWMGTLCEDECVDKNKLCNANPGYPPRFCQNPEFGHQIVKYCPLMCGVCVGRPGQNIPRAFGRNALWWPKYPQRGRW